MSSSTTSTSVPITAKGAAAVAFNHPISIKLDKKNYLLWRLQISAAIQGHGLDEYIAGKDAIPVMYSSEEDRAANKLNPEYVAWKKQDALLLSWLLSTMSETMFTRIVGCKHSYEVWDRVLTHFGNNTHAKIHQYRTELRNIKKGSRTMEEYLLKVKSITDALVAIGSEVSDHEYIQRILEGLPSEYESFVTGFHMRSEPCSVYDLEPLLIAQEIRVEKNLKAVSTDPPSANMDLKDKGSSSFKSNNYQNQPKQFNNRGGGRQNFGRGRGRGNNNNRGGFNGGYSGFQVTNNRPYVMCQVCGKGGHIASVCYHRLDTSYQLNEQQYNQQLRQRSSGNMSAMVATPEILNDSSWFPDSGASNHVTADGGNLMNSSEYMGHEQLHMGNGAGLNITSDTKEILLKGSVRPDGLYSFHDFHLQHLPSSSQSHLPSTASSSSSTQLPSVHSMSVVSDALSPQSYACTRFTWIYPLKTKGEALSAFIEFKKMAELNLGFNESVFPYQSLFSPAKSTPSLTNGSSSYCPLVPSSPPKATLPTPAPCPLLHNIDGSNDTMSTNTPLATSTPSSSSAGHLHASSETFSAHNANEVPLAHDVDKSTTADDVDTSSSSAAQPSSSALNPVSQPVISTHPMVTRSKDVTGSSATFISRLKSKLTAEFALKDLGYLHYFLGIEVQQLPDGSLHLSQGKYINDLLCKAKMESAKSLSTPMVSSVKLVKEGVNLMNDPHLYRSKEAGRQVLTSNPLDQRMTMKETGEDGDRTKVEDDRAMPWRCNGQEEKTMEFAAIGLEK
ncbi:Retrovirus-related Pol polyprotein from transposon TNT 1-94 [Senna tora]|uniref:Retrovirus-related Pol polyprotein from transposon TNT 1-94 n=1 Tax=Senna tora TaxID=362788 RepID=A0A835CH03_9FABA|nr:Retrovirus-related Pol polyprotein from transposon TNT 1-94 [Senna tora]